MARKAFINKLKSFFLRKTRKSKVVERSDEKNSAVYIVSSSIILAGMLVAAVVFFFGTKIMRSIDEIKYQYDPNNPLGIRSLVSYAYDLGIDTKWFESCVKTGKYDDKIKEDQNDGQSAGVQGTPSIYVGEFISDQRIRGFQVDPSYGTIEYAVNKINEKGVDEASKDVYQFIYDQAFEYYKSQEGMNEDKAKTEADKYAGKIKDIKELSVGSFPGLKSGNPKVAIVEFTDFECPYCKNFAQNSVPRIKDNLVNKGSVAYYLRMFPLEGMHPNAKNGARAAFCANEKGRFWEMHDWLFEIVK